MKLLVILTSIACSFLIQPQEEKMFGKYKMEYDQDYASLNGTITFDGVTFKRNQLDGKKVKGDVDYQKNFIFLNEKKSHLQVIFAKREMKNDTIYFRTKDLNDKSPEMELVVFAGKLIKQK